MWSFLQSLPSANQTSNRPTNARSASASKLFPFLDDDEADDDDIRYLPPIVRAQIISKKRLRDVSNEKFDDEKTGRTGTLSRITRTEIDLQGRQKDRGQEHEGKWVDRHGKDGTWFVVTQYANDDTQYTSHDETLPIEMVFTQTDGARVKAIADTPFSDVECSVTKDTPFGTVWVDSEGPIHQITDTRAVGYVDTESGHVSLRHPKGRKTYSATLAPDRKSWRARAHYCPTHVGQDEGCTPTTCSQQQVMTKVVARGHIWKPEFAERRV